MSHAVEDELERGRRVPLERRQVQGRVLCLHATRVYGLYRRALGPSYDLCRVIKVDGLRELEWRVLRLCRVRGHTTLTHRRFPTSQEFAAYAPTCLTGYEPRLSIWCKRAGARSRHTPRTPPGAAPCSAPVSASGLADRAHVCLRITPGRLRGGWRRRDAVSF